MGRLARGKIFGKKLMVQLMKSGNPKPVHEMTSYREKVPVKLEIIEDSLEEEHGPLSKRSKPSSTLQQQVCFVPEIVKEMKEKN